MGEQGERIGHWLTR